MDGVTDGIASAVGRSSARVASRWGCAIARAVELKFSSRHLSGRAATTWWRCAFCWKGWG